jgi:hypothetical protein
LVPLIRLLEKEEAKAMAAASGPLLLPPRAPRVANPVAPEHRKLANWLSSMAKTIERTASSICRPSPDQQAVAFGEKL